MTSMVNYGVIGCGMMGQEHLRNIALLPHSGVSAIFEPNKHMRDLSKSLAPDAKLCRSIEELLKQPDLNCLLIASPNFVHIDQFEEITKRRPLPLLIEKPLFTDPSDVKRIAQLERHYPEPVWVAMEYRYMPPISMFVDQVKSATGRITMLTIREHRFPFLPKVDDWNRFNRYSGGTLVEKCCHFFDLMRLIIQSEPVRVMASGGQDVNHLDESYQGEVPDIWDGAFVIVDFENGVRAMLELCMYAEGSEYQEEITAVGPEGKIEVKVPGPTRFWNSSEKPPPTPKILLSPRGSSCSKEFDIPVDPELLAVGDHNGATFFQHQLFADVVRGRAKPEVTVSDGAMAVRMAMAAQQSAETGQAVSISPR